MDTMDTMPTTQKGPYEGLIVFIVRIVSIVIAEGRWQ
jgi:hypothetical protein